MEKNKKVILLLGMILSTSLIWFSAEASQDHKWIIIHHEDQGRPNDERWEKCMPHDAWNGHKNHEGDFIVGPCDPPVTDVPTSTPNTATVEPTSTNVLPTDTPVPSVEPTITKTTNPPTDTPNPTATRVAPTNEPTKIVPTSTNTEITCTCVVEPTDTPEPACVEHINEEIGETQEVGRADRVMTEIFTILILLEAFSFVILVLIGKRYFTR